MREITYQGKTYAVEIEESQYLGPYGEMPPLKVLAKPYAAISQSWGEAVPITIDFKTEQQCYDRAYLDVYNWPGIGESLRDRGIAYPVGYIFIPKQGKYPLYRFHLDRL